MDEARLNIRFVIGRSFKYRFKVQKVVASYFWSGDKKPLMCLTLIYYALTSYGKMR